MEEHDDGNKHYHMCIKFSANRRWKEGKNSFYRKHGISVHFSGSHTDYASAFEYVMKEDLDAVKSADHPPLLRAAKTRQATVAVRNKSNAKRGVSEPEPSGSGGKKRVTAGMISNFIIENNIHTDKEMYEAINLQKKDGQTDLNEFILSKPPKYLNDLLNQSWQIENAVLSRQRRDTPRMNLVMAALHGACVHGCNGQWLICANDTLRKNKVNRYVFADAIRSAIKDGRQKGNNIMITGVGDSAKTFILLPVTIIFEAFTNPAKTNFAWGGVEEKEIIFLNDVRYSEKLLDWTAMLNLLDGNDVRFPRPKHFHESDILMTRDNKIPVFATSIDKIKYYGENEEEETKMMDLRWRLFRFTHKIPKEERKVLAPCPKCFAQMSMLGSEFDS